MKRVALLPMFFMGLALLLLQAKPQSQGKALVFTHITVIDATGAPAKPDMTVVITGERIAELGKTGRVRVPRDAQVIDAAGKFLIPGLWDMHVHLEETERSLPMFIANGVTGVRNMGGRPEHLFRWRAEIASGKVLGPRVVACGPVVDGPQPANPDHAIAVHNAAEGRQAVNRLKQNGADFVKVYDGVPRDVYFAIVDEAKKTGLPVAGHVPLSVTMMEASDTGQKSVEHLGTFLEFCSNPEASINQQTEPPGDPNDFSAFPRRIAARGNRMLDTYDEKKAARLFAQLAKNKTWQVPTLVVKRVQAFIDDIHRAGDSRLRYIPQANREWWSPQKNFFFRYRTLEYIAYRKRLFQREMETVRAMRRMGVPFLAGTDVGGAYTFPGFSLHDELGLLVQAGFTPMEALQAATRNPAEFLGELSLLGTVEKGKLADLVLLDANPLEDITNMQKINAVVINGRLFDKKALDDLLAQVEAAARK